MTIGSGGVSSVLGGAQGELPTWPGIYYGAVASNADPKKKNRCQLRVPQLLGSAITTWALPLTPMVDPPAVGTLVSVMFSGGDLDYPVYLVVNPAVPIETTNGNVQPVSTTASAGTSHKVAAADHVHTLANALESTAGNIQPVAAAAVAGTSPKAARADHVHSGIAPGSGSFEVSSGVTGLGDTAATIDLFSRNTAGQTEIDLTAVNTNISGNVDVQGANLNVGNGSTSNINLNPQMVPPSTWPLTNDSNTGSSWATGERQFINDLNTAVNGIINSLRVHGLMQ